MDKHKIIDLFGNILLGVCAPYLFLISDNPFKVLCGENNKLEKEFEKNGNNY